MPFCEHLGTPLTSFVDHFSLVSVFCILPCLCLAALWSPAGKGLTSRRFCMWRFLVLLSLSHKVSWIRSGTWLYWFLIFAFFLIFFLLTIAGLEISQNRHLPCITKFFGIYGKIINLHWKSSKVSLALQPEALVNTSGRVDFSSPE